MSTWPLIAFLSAVALGASPGAAELADPPAAVSPGSETDLLRVSSRCPTFSWGVPPGPVEFFELAVFRLDRTDRGDEPVLLQRLPGVARSWTPDLERCLTHGVRYAWSVRSTSGESVSDWSPTFVFEVPESVDLRARQGIPDPLGSSDAHRSVTPRVQAPATGERNDPPRPSTRDERTADPLARASRAAITIPSQVGFRSVRDDTEEPSFAIYGLSHSDDQDSAALVGETTAESGVSFGVLGLHTGGSSQGAPGAFSRTGEGSILQGFFSEEEVFRVDTGGNLRLGGELVCADCVSGVNIRDDTLTGAHIAQGSLTGADIANATITGADIATGTITGSDIATGTITASDIASRSITGAKIATATIGEQNLANGSVGGYELDQISVVSIECEGNCSDVTLGEICGVAGANRRPVFVDCDQASYHNLTEFSCLNGKTCSLNSVLHASDRLGLMCLDQNGWDANVFCLDDDD